MKPAILVLYYTQTGQLQRILESIVSGMEGKADIDAVEIEPEAPYPFPWDTHSYWNLLPGAMAQTPVLCKPHAIDITAKNYDLIILGYQPWFLNPSPPMLSFLQSEYAQVLKNKPVITVTGSRNMWLHAQERVKEYLTGLNAHLAGNIALTDCVPAPLSCITSARWMFKGKKEWGDLFPDAGIADKDIIEARHLGPQIYKHLTENNLIDLQRELLSLGAVKVTAAMIAAEQRMLKQYRKGAKYIAGANDTDREKRVKQFRNMLVLRYIFWPVFFLSTLIKLIVKGPALQKDKEYFRQLQYDKSKFPE